MNNYNEEHPQVQLISFIGEISKNYGKLVAIITNIEQAINNTTPKLRDIDAISTQIHDLKTLINEQRNNINKMVSDLDVYSNNSGEALNKILSLTEVMEKMVLDLKDRSDAMNKDDKYLEHMRHVEYMLKNNERFENLVNAWNLTIKETEVFIDDLRIGILDIKNIFNAVNSINKMFLFFKEKKAVVVTVIGFLLFYIQSDLVIDKFEFLLSTFLLFIK